MRNVREWVARDKDIFYCLFQVKPTYLGEKIDIHGNGDVTNDQQEPIVSTYVLEGNIYVGIDLNSGFFQVECEDIDKMRAVWDDLFLARGLSEKDIKNLMKTSGLNRSLVFLCDRKLRCNSCYIKCLAPTVVERRAYDFGWK